MRNEGVCPAVRVSFGWVVRLLHKALSFHDAIQPQAEQEKHFTWAVVNGSPRFRGAEVCLRYNHVKATEMFL